MAEGISKEEVLALLKDYEIGEISIVKPLETSGNIAFIITVPGRKYFFRLSPSGMRWRSEKEIEAELELIDHLLQNNFPVPKPVADKNGKRVISWENHFGYLREYMEAEPKLEPIAKEVEEFGELLGRFHNLIENYKTKNKREHTWDLEETRKNFEQDKEIILKSEFAEKEEFIKRFEEEISKLDFPDSLSSGTIHEDLGKRHVLWNGNEIIGILDFDRAYYGKLILDLGQACRGWCFTEDWKKWSNENFKALIAGYQKERNLIDEEKKYLVDAIKFGILERALSFLLRFSFDQKNLEDKEYALYSISENGPLGIVEKNRNEIEKIIL